MLTARAPRDRQRQAAWRTGRLVASDSTIFDVVDSGNTLRAVPGNALRVVLADDHHFFREGLRGMLESAGVSVVGEARDGAEAVALAAELKPDVVVIDLDIPDAAGAEALRRIATASPEARVVVLTASAEEAEVLEALEAGACSYILKDTQADELVGGIRQTAVGQVVLSREIVRALVKRASPNEEAANRSQPVVDRPALTTREMDVLRLIVRRRGQRGNRP